MHSPIESFGDRPRINIPIQTLFIVISFFSFHECRLRLKMHSPIESFGDRPPIESFGDRTLDKPITNN